MGFIPSHKAGEQMGQEVTVRGFVEDHQWISGRSGRPHLLLFDTPALVERGSKISEQEIPDTFTVVVWREDTLKPENKFTGSTNFGPVYPDKVVCVTGTIENELDGAGISVDDMSDPVFIEEYAGGYAMLLQGEFDFVDIRDRLHDAGHDDETVVGMNSGKGEVPVAYMTWLSVEWVLSACQVVSNENSHRKALLAF